MGQRAIRQPCHVGYALVTIHVVAEVRVHQVVATLPSGAVPHEKELHVMLPMNPARIRERGRWLRRRR